MQEIDDLLAGALTSEDEEAVEEELSLIIKQSLPDVPQQQVDMQNDADLALPNVPSELPEPAKEKSKIKEPVLLSA